MGCCVSTDKASAPNKRQRLLVGSETRCNAPSPPPLEEESVKEVLSETPTPKPALVKIEEEKKPVLKKNEEEEKKVTMSIAEEISEVSEICSLSESVSTTTITTERREDDDGEVRQRVDRSPAKFPRNRSYSGDLRGRRDRVVGKSPGRRSDGPVRSVSGRGEVNQATVRRGSGRGSGDSSGRRSRSPATRTDGGATRPGIGRSPSARKTGRSPGRMTTAAPESSRKVEESSGSKEGKWGTTNESLENPLVSLECFIFL